MYIFGHFEAKSHFSYHWNQKVGSGLRATCARDYAIDFSPSQEPAQWGISIVQAAAGSVDGGIEGERMVARPGQIAHDLFSLCP